MKFVLPLFISSLFISANVLSQSIKGHVKAGDKFYDREFYRYANMEYQKAYEIDRENATVLFKLGRGHIKSYQFEEALEFLKRAEEIDPTVDKYLPFWIARAYHLNSQFDDAMSYYSNYSTSLNKRDKRKEEVLKYIEECEFGLEYTRNPKNYKITNIGPPVNTAYSEHSPVLSQNGEQLYFASQQVLDEQEAESKGKELYDHIFKSTKLNDGSWDKPGNIALDADGEASVQLFDNDTKLLLYESTSGGDIYVSTFDGQRWGEPEKMPVINSAWPEVDAYISVDGEVLVFASSIENHGEDFDLYMCRRKGDSWTEPEKLPDEINTAYDESSPFISRDKKYLYFSSNGHGSMGGYDVYRAEFNEETQMWESPVNLGVPINTPSDDIYFYFTNQNEWAGYMSSVRPGGFGEKDIYLITFLPNIIVKGKVQDFHTKNAVSDVKVEFFSVAKDEVVATSTSLKNGDYDVNILPNDEYNIRMKDENGVVIGEHHYEVGILKEDDPLEYELDLNIDKGSKHNEIPQQLAASSNNLDESSVPELSEDDIEEGYELVQDDAGHTYKRRVFNASVPSSSINEEPLNEELTNEDEFIEELAVEGDAPDEIEFSETSPKMESGGQENFTGDNVPLNGKSFVLRNVYFDFNKSSLKPESTTELTKLLTFLNSHKNLRIEIGGHTDYVGSANYNKRLSEKRARSVVRYLVEKGISSRRLEAVGYGEEMPMASNDDEEEGRELNRRTTFKILNSDIMSLNNQ